jgi:hypothetical protein
MTQLFLLHCTNPMYFFFSLILFHFPFFLYIFFRVAWCNSITIRSLYIGKRYIYYFLGQLNAYASDGRMTKRRSRVGCVIPTTHPGRSSNVKVNPKVHCSIWPPLISQKGQISTTLKIPRLRNLFWENIGSRLVPSQTQQKKVHWLFFNKQLFVMCGIKVRWGGTR